MPNLDFILPLWLYWAGLLLFPLLAMALVRRQRRRAPRRGPSLPVAYLFWLCAGFLGVHRFYLRSAVGVAFIAVFLGALYCNAQVRGTRDAVSRTFVALEQAQRQADLAGAAETPAQRAQLDESVRAYAAARTINDAWHDRTRLVALLLGLGLLADAALLPRLVRRRAALEVAEPQREVEHAPPPVFAVGTGEDPTLAVHSRLTDAIEWLNVRIGEYVAYWAVIAVFAYYYEVLARYVFNSPTNWVHESMFLMFGMQYLLSGAYAYREDQHVRVDVLYSRFSPRGRAIADLVTSVFFFIFIVTMLWTGTRFAWDAIGVDEHSFTEWGVQYWPVKLAIPVGAALMLLQGLAKLIKDVLIVARGVR